MKVRINIALKTAVLDIQGKAIENSLVKNLQYSQISNVRQGRFVDLEINEIDEDKIKIIISEICDKLLVNNIIEEYSFEFIKTN